MSSFSLPPHFLCQHSFPLAFSTYTSWKSAHLINRDEKANDDIFATFPSVFVQRSLTLKSLS